MIPLLIYFLGPQLHELAGHRCKPSSDESWLGLANSVWRFIIRPIAVGTMMVGTCFTLFKMRKNLIAGLAKAFSELRGSGAQEASVSRTERYMSSKTVFGLIAVTFILMCILYIYMSGMIGGAIAAALVMLIVGFFFATVSGYLVGVIGSSNNPISGLTLSTLVIAALLMVTLGVSGTGGVVAVLAVAAVVCVSSAVAGELLQDFKVGYILGGTPRSIQIDELIAVVVASCMMYFPLLWLHLGNIHKGGIGFGDRELSAPQAGLMASLAQGIVGGDMAWPLIDGRYPAGHRHDHVQGEEPDAGRDRHVLAGGHHVRDFLRRHGALAQRFDREETRHERSAEGAHRERGRVSGVRDDRGRGANGIGDGDIQLHEKAAAGCVRASFLHSWIVCPDCAGLHSGQSATLECGASGRSTASCRVYVSSAAAVTT